MAQQRPHRRVRYATPQEANRLSRHERKLRRADRRDGGHRYRDFRREEDRRFAEALAADGCWNTFLGLIFLGALTVLVLRKIRRES